MSAEDNTTLIQVKVKPREKVSSLTQNDDGQWSALIKSPPIDGKSNAELIGLVAAHFGVPKANVSIKSGTRGRMKWVRVNEA